MVSVSVSVSYSFGGDSDMLGGDVANLTLITRWIGVYGLQCQKLD
jgi:hypothetical protein